MHFYSFHPGDYLRDTAHLTPMEDITYRRLLDLYYSSEAPIPLETHSVSRRLRLDTETVDSVLNEFFQKTPEGWRQPRCDAEIAIWNQRGWMPSELPPLRPPIHVWKKTRIRIFERDSYTCAYCGQVGGQLECDHVIPISRNGSNDDSNLVTSCKRCNRAKSNKIS